MAALCMASVSCGGGKTDEVTSDIERLAGVFWNTSCMDLNQERIDAMTEMQVYADSCSNVEFERYCAAGKAEAVEMEKGSILHYHQMALEKLVREIPEEKVEEGSVAIWQLYNMGYVVKTPSHCFAIDIKHREGERLVPFIDFSFITHNHDDHYTEAFVKAMADAGKPVYSNFLDNPYKLTDHETVKPLESSDIKFESWITDHNARLVNFVVSYQIDCGEDAGHIVIFDIGDTYNSSQLNPGMPTDIFIPHLAVGLDMPDAVKRVNPACVFMSHMLELGHAVDKWRWSFQYCLDSCDELRDALAGSECENVGIYLPVWGEKVIYRR